MSDTNVTPWHMTRGKGAPMIVMGGVHLDHSYMRPWLDPLSDGAKLTFLDHRGTGRSPLSDLGGRTHDDWADDIEQLRTEDGLGPIILFGHSYGGFLALNYALRYPGSLRGLILCDTAAAFDYFDVALEIAQQHGTPKQVELLIRGFSAPITSDAELKRIWLEVAPIYFVNISDAIRRQFDSGTTYSAAAFNHFYFRCLPHYNVTARLGEISAPTLVLAGRHDWVAPADPAAQRLHEGIRGSELTIFGNSGHYPFMEEHTHFLQIVVAWLARYGEGSPV
jgi:proline iminopeptidase